MMRVLPFWGFGGVGVMLRTMPLLLGLLACSSKDQVPPVADAGPDQLVTSGVMINLDGSGSQDRDGTIASYAWTLISSPEDSAAVLEGDGAERSMRVDVCGRFVVSLEVTDNDGNQSYPDMAEIVCTSAAERPVARLSASGLLGVGLPLVLDGSESTAPDDTALSDWDFSLLVTPEGASGFITQDETDPQRAQLEPDMPGVWIVGLTVSDGTLDSRATTLALMVADEANQPPVANCGSDQLVSPGGLVALDGAASVDPDGDAIAYAWTLSSPEESAAALIGADQAVTRFEADVPGTFEASLIVSDGSLSSDPCQVTVQVQDTIDNRAPVAEAGADVILSAPGLAAQLDGLASFDPDGDPLSVSWTLSSAPVSSTLTTEDMVAADQLLASLTPDTEGTFIIQLTVCDSGLLCATDATRVIVGETGNRAPQADAGSDREAEVGVGVPLDGTQSTDPDGDALTFLWSIHSAPAGSAALIEDADSSTPSFSPDIEGEFLIRLDVSDGAAGASDWIAVTAYPEGTNLSPACATTGDQTTDMEVGILVDGSLTFDPNDDTLRFAWSVLTGPTGTPASFDDPGSSSTVFTPIEPGEYVLQFAATDGEEECTELIVVTAIDTSPNTPPSCDAGGDITVDLGDVAVLDGSGSSDPDGDPLSYEWTIYSAPSGSGVTIEAPASAVTNMTPDVPGVYELSLTVADAEESCTEFIVVDVQEPVINTPPSCEAGPNQSVEVDAIVSLDASGSSDADGDPLTYAWTFTSRPDGSVSGIIDRTAATATFFPDVDGTYQAEVTVSDGTASCTDQFTLTVFPVNTPPTCNAGPDLSGLIGERAALDGSGSTDLDGDVLTYSWSFTERPEGSVNGLLDRTSDIAGFFPDVAGVYTAQLSVSDGTDTCTDNMVLTAESANTPPSCDAGGDLTAIVDERITFDGSGSSDAEGDALSYSWSFVSRPEESLNGLIDRTSVTADFIPDVPGTYAVELTVSDGEESCTALASLTAESANTPPLCDAGPDISATAGETVALDGTGSSDPDGDTLAFEWNFTSKPEASVNGIIGKREESAGFIPDVAGTYAIVLTVSDAEDSCTSEMTLTVAPNTPPDCSAGPDLVVAIGDRATLDGSGTTDVEGDTIGYSWSFTSRPEGSVNGLIDRTSAVAGFFPDVAGSYTIQLTAEDIGGACSDAMTLTVDDETGGSDTGGGGGDGAPTADAGRDLILCALEEVELDGTDSSGTSLSYSWAFVSTPVGSSLTDTDLIGASSATPAFTPDAEGRFELSLTVTDALGSDTDTITVTLNADGSVVTLHLDERGGSVAEDGSPSGNDGNVTNPDWTGGRFFGGLSFDGSSFITIPDDDSLDFSGDFTIDWWMRTDDLAPDWRAVMTKGEAYNYSIWTVGNEVYFYTVTDSGSYLFVGGESETIGDGGWHHYAATIGDGEMRLYADGVLLASEVLTDPLLTNASSLVVGRSASSTLSEFFVGALDEVVIRSGTLSAEQIAILADADTQTCTGAEDDGAPSASITSPVSGSTTEIGYIKVEGTASDDSAIAAVTVNGAIAAATSTDFSSWVAYVPLTEGSNNLIAQVTDVAGNTSSDADSVVATFNDICGDETALLLAFDEDTADGASDWSPDENDGTETGVDRVIGRYGNALSVSGSGGVSVPHSDDLAGGGPISLETWLRRDGPSTDLEVIAAKGDPSSYGMALFGETLIFGFDDEALTEYATVATGVTDGDWHHIVGVFDGTELSLYIDGGLASSTPTFGGIPVTHTQDLAVGSFFGLGAALTGQVDQLRVYNRALSASQVVDLFDSGEACPLGENLALLASASASSTLNPLFSASNTIDGETVEDAELDYTMWLAENDSAGWVELDLGDVVGVLRVRWANTHNRTFLNRATTAYRIEASVTGAFGDEAIAIASGTDTLETELAFHTEESSPVAARYLRFYADDWDGLGPGINEIQVFGLE